MKIVDTVSGRTVSVSTGNMKTGNIPSMNLTPIRTCKGATDGCKKDCYALKSYKQYPNVRTAWDGNADAVETDPTILERAITLYLDGLRTLPSAFRWHSSGDFVSEDHFAVAVRLAEKYPTVRWFGYTKNRDLLPMLENLPSNLTMFVSMWVDLPVPVTSAPLAWYQDGTETRATGITCPATKSRPVTCDKCGLCPSKCRTETKTRNIVFNAH